MVTALCAGCVADRLDDQDAPSAQELLATARPLQQNAPLKHIVAYQFVVRLKIVPVQVPVGLASGSDRLWNYVDEEVGGVKTALALNRNGFRVGVGQTESWPAVQKVLTELTGSTPTVEEGMVLPGVNRPIVLKQRQNVQTIFVVGDDGIAVGRDYPPGDNILMTEFRLVGDDPSGLLMHMAPVIQTTRQYEQPVQEGPHIRLEARPETFALTPLEFSMRLTSGQFVMIGPRSPEQTGSPGYHFLIRDRDGLRIETLLVLVPEVWASPMPRERL